MTNNRVYDDAFRTFTFSMQQSVSFTHQHVTTLWQKKKSAALFTKILTIKNCRKCKTKIIKSFTKILTIILSVKIVLTLHVKLPCRKCKILNVREIFVLSFFVSEKSKKEKKDGAALALRLETKRAIL